jgi:hypothetical protein
MKSLTMRVRYLRTTRSRRSTQKSVARLAGWQWHGVKYQAAFNNDLARQVNYRLVAVPYRLAFAVAALPLAALPVPSVLSRLRRCGRLRRGLCPLCGYDLRATSGRCPVCGAEAGANSSGSAPE